MEEISIYFCCIYAACMFYQFVVLIKDILFVHILNMALPYYLGNFHCMHVKFIIFNMKCTLNLNIMVQVYIYQGFCKIAIRFRVQFRDINRSNSKNYTMDKFYIFYMAPNINNDHKMHI